jgi:hypothetical protein
MKVDGLMSNLFFLCESSSEEPPRYVGPSSSLKSTMMGLLIPGGGRNAVPAGAIALASIPPGLLTLVGAGEEEQDSLKGEDAATCMNEDF